MEKPATTITIVWVDDEHVDIKLNGEAIYSTNHGDHGWDGMEAVIGMATNLGRRIGATIEQEGKPNLPLPPLVTYVAHLPECDPDAHPDWVEKPYRDALNSSVALCPDTQYMAGELFPEEPVWVETVSGPEQSGRETP